MFSTKKFISLCNFIRSIYKIKSLCFCSDCNQSKKYYRTDLQYNNLYIITKLKILNHFRQLDLLSTGIGYFSKLLINAPLQIMKSLSYLNDPMFDNYL